jgi:hypothetical protein
MDTAWYCILESKELARKEVDMDITKWKIWTLWGMVQLSASMWDSRPYEDACCHMG